LNAPPPTLLSLLSLPDALPTSPGAPNGKDVETFARFMRATKAPARDAALAATADATAGAAIFDALGCDFCHVPAIVTAPPGTVINGGALPGPAALGNKRTPPFGPLLPPALGTADGIVHNARAAN